jgi:hypothetical protein
LTREEGILSICHFPFVIFYFSLPAAARSPLGQQANDKWKMTNGK